ncbi:MAG: Purine nucleoside phosphorylase [Chthoniobacteraceae bacterium]|nr:Purine nucleoside phosphorylase [Chthoniobacteraceae bacterium]
MTSQEIDGRAKEFAPTTGIVLGSGLGGLVGRVEVAFTLPFTSIDRLPASKVPGHAGQFVFGHLGKARVVIAQGRAHLYEGWSAFEVTSGVRFMASLGIRRLILTNAAGTLAFPPGTWMMLTDHLNLTGTSPLLGTANFVDMTGIYSAPLRRHFLKIAQAEGIPLHEGVYAGVLGPQYETPAEIRMLRTMGADAVGMSTVLEAIQARALGIELAAFSCLTNWAAGISPQSLSHADVLATGHDASGSLMRLLELGVPV